MPKATRVKSRAPAVPVGLSAKSATPTPLATPSGSPQRPLFAQKHSPAPATASSAPAAAASDKASKKERKLARRQEWINKLSTASSRASSSAHDARVRGKPLLSLTTDWKSELKQLGTSGGAAAQPTSASANGADMDHPVQKQKQQPVIKSRKAKQNQLKSEAARFQAVLNHAAFKADPFATIQTHLKNTLGSQQ